MRDVCCADSLHGLPIYVRSKDEMLSFLNNEHFLCHSLYHSLMDYQKKCRIPRRGSAPLAGVQHAAGARGHRRGVQHGPVRRRQHPAAAGRGQHAGEPQGAARAAAAARPVPGAAGRRPVWRRGLGRAHGRRVAHQLETAPAATAALRVHAKRAAMLCAREQIGGRPGRLGLAVLGHVSRCGQWEAGERHANVCLVLYVPPDK